eukprot:scaffold6815_cov213-Alexandrium_tamarense.AAC.2
MPFSSSDATSSLMTSSVAQATQASGPLPPSPAHKRTPDDDNNDVHDDASTDPNAQVTNEELRTFMSNIIHRITTIEQNRHSATTTTPSHSLKGNVQKLDNAITQLIETTSTLAEHTKGGGGKPRLARGEAVKTIQERVLPDLLFVAHFLRNLTAEELQAEIHEQGKLQNTGGGKRGRIGKRHLDATVPPKKARGGDSGGVGGSSTKVLFKMQKPPEFEAVTSESLAEDMDMNEPIYYEEANRQCSFLPVELPPPKNGTEYEKSEAVRIINTFKRNSQMRGRAIRTMMAKKYVPASRRTIYGLLKRDEEGLPIVDDSWRVNGTPKREKSATAIEYSEDDPLYNLQSFPTMTCPQLMSMWLLGNVEEGIPPYSQLSTKNFPSIPNARCYLYGMRKFMQFVESMGRQHGQWKEKWDHESVLELWGAVGAYLEEHKFMVKGVDKEYAWRTIFLRLAEAGVIQKRKKKGEQLEDDKEDEDVGDDSYVEEF